MVSKPIAAGWALGFVLMIVLGLVTPRAWATTVDFETPPLGTAAREIISPYTANGVTFTTESSLGDAVVGLVRNRVTSACVEPADENQKLGTGRKDSSISGGGVGLSPYPIKATFSPVLSPTGTAPVSVSVEFQTSAGATARLRLFDPSGVEVASVSDLALPADGTCGMPGEPRARKVLTAIARQPVAYAIMDVLPSDRIFVIDNFSFGLATDPRFCQQPKLVGWWKFDQVGSSSTVLDSSGNGNDGQLVGGAVRTAGIDGGAVQFFGGSDAVQIPFSDSLRPAWGTVTLWFKVNSQQLADLFVTTNLPTFNNPTATSKALVGIRLLSNGHLYGVIQNRDDPLQTSRWSYIEAGDYSPDRWHHAALRWDGTKIDLFLDGNLVGSEPYQAGRDGSIPYTPSYGAFGFGYGITGGGELEGLLDDARLYCGVLSDKEIAQMASLSSSPAPPASVEQFDANGNCYIEDTEFFAAVDAWIDGEIPDDLFFAVIDAWAGQTNVCLGGAGYPSTKPRLPGVLLTTHHLESHMLTFTVHGRGIASMRVEVFDLAGRGVFSQETDGRRLTWNLRMPDGKRVANGVYLYAMTVHSYDGEVIRSEVKKLFILRGPF